MNTTVMAEQLLVTATLFRVTAAELRRLAKGPIQTCAWRIADLCRKSVIRQVQRSDAGSVIAQESLPTLRRWPATPDHIPADS
jgi:hypothetical protein